MNGKFELMERKNAENVAKNNNLLLYFEEMEIIIKMHDCHFPLQKKCLKK